MTVTEIVTEAPEETEAPAEEPAKETASADSEQVFVDWGYVYRVQLALNEAGYDCGKADGFVGEKTFSSMNKYQEEHGLPVTRDITAALLDSLGIEYPI